MDIWKIRPYVLHCKGQNPLEDEWEELGMMQAADDDEFSFMHFLWTQQCLKIKVNITGYGQRRQE